MTLSLITKQFLKDLINNKGINSNVIIIDKFGFNPSVPVSTLVDVWPQTAALVYLTAAETMDIVSTDAADDGNPQGTGCGTVVIEGVNNDYEPINETVVLEGLTPVETVKSYIRVNRIFCENVGSNGVNVGDITATASVAATVQAIIKAALGQTEQSHYTVPLKCKAILVDWSSSCGKGDDFALKFFAREFGKSWRKRSSEFVFQNTVTHDFKGDVVLNEKSDIRVTAIGTAGNKPIETDYSLILVPQ